MTSIEFEQVRASFAFDPDRRTITGVVMPYGKIGRHSNGRRWKFSPGSIVFGHAKYVFLNDEHVHSARIGRAVSHEVTEEGLVMTFKIDQTPLGDKALADAADRQRNGLSAEVDIDTVDAVPDPDDPGVMLVNLSNLTGVGLVRRPAFSDARLISVKASYSGGTMTEPTPTPAPAPTPDPAPAPTPDPAPAPLPDGQTITLDAPTAAQFSAWLASRGVDDDPRPTVNPTGPVPVTAPVQVSEPLPYRFSWHELPGSQTGKTVFAADGEHDFSTDMFSVIKASQLRMDPGDALKRVNAMIQAAFADVERADVTATNPNTHRPDMWVRQRDYRTVLWEMIAAGTTNGKKFDVPKFNSSSGLVGPATEKTEPAGGSFVAELQTITPTQVWGKVEITRQAWRDGGSPALSGILWDQMLREYYEDREAAVATFLNTLTSAADITLTGTPASTPDNDDDQVTVNDLEAAIAMLQFDRGGDQISAFAVHRDLYKVLARVKDDAGRPLYPINNPQNANGSAQPRFRTMNVAGVTAVGSYALGASGTAAANSWLFDPATVFGWASAPERLFWDFGATVQTANIPQLSFVTLGIYGDIALANTDIAGVRQVIFDPSV